MTEGEGHGRGMHLGRGLEIHRLACVTAHSVLVLVGRGRATTCHTVSALEDFITLLHG